MSFYKNGIINTNLLNEIQQESDDSLFAPCFVHINPTGQKFSSSDTFSTGVFHSGEMWLNFNICKELTSWEFLALQADTQGDTIRKYRWTQTKSPFNATWTDVQPSAVTRNTSGYTDAGTTYGGGIYVANGDSTYIITAASTSGWWWGAVGCKVDYNGGIPGFGGKLCSTGFMMILVKVSTAQFRLFKTPNSVLTNEIIEY